MKSPLYILGFMLALAAVFGSAVTGIHLAGAKTLEANRTFLFQRSLVGVFDLAETDGMDAQQVADLVQRRIVTDKILKDPESGWETDLIEAYEDDAHSKLRGHGFRFRGRGFWGPISGILALTPDHTKTLGLVILEQKETPGLGGRVAKPEFTQQFTQGILTAPPSLGQRYLVVCATRPTGEDAARRHVDGITGATRTSIAMDGMLNEHLARFHRAFADSAIPNAEGK
ncbi:MAG: FMN-binding protein [Lentisphaeria bacterium]|nr:FMN-binding protein [Lentisphaeria bacterium]